MDRWREKPEIRATLALLAGSGVLVGAGTAGVAASPWLLAGLVAAAAVLWGLGRAVADTAVERLDPRRYVADLWLGPLLSGVVLAGFLDASAGEVQALGGLLGLAGMANYFLRPVYHLLYAGAVRVAKA